MQSSRSSVVPSICLNEIGFRNPYHPLSYRLVDAHRHKWPILGPLNEWTQWGYHHLLAVNSNTPVHWVGFLQISSVAPLLYFLYDPQQNVVGIV